jgi:hypothetical protein
VHRFRELPFDVVAFWHESGISLEALEQWIAAHAGRIRDADGALALGTSAAGTLGVIELRLTLDDDKTYTQRAVIDRSRAVHSLEEEAGAFREFAVRELDRMGSAHGVRLPLSSDVPVALHG